MFNGSCIPLLMIINLYRETYGVHKMNSPFMLECGWLSPSSIKNEGDVRCIKYETHILIN